MDVEGADVVTVRVPRAERSQRPVYINGNLNTGTYRRNGEGDYRCTMETISSMVRDNADAPFDKEPLIDFGLDAFSSASVNAYRSEFAALRPNHAWAGLEQTEFLLRIGAIARAKEDGGLHPTKAGLLMFGEAWRITDAFPNYFLDCRQVVSDRRWDNRVTSDDGDWSGNVYDFWNKARTMLCEGLPTPFELGSGLLKIDDTPQHEAVREGLTNALVHADYQGRTGVVVIRHWDSVEFSNPGCLRLPVEVIAGGGVSDPRNKTLMTMFNLIGRGDKAGSGFDVLRRAALYAGVKEPQLEEMLEPDRVKLMLYVEPDGSKISNEVVLERVGNVGNDVGNVGNDVGNVGNDVGNVGDGAGVAESLGGASAGQAILKLLASEPKISAASIAERLGLSKRHVERVIRALREAGFIRRVDGTRGYWEVREVAQ